MIHAFSDFSQLPGQPWPSSQIAPSISSACISSSTPPRSRAGERSTPSTLSRAASRLLWRLSRGAVQAVRFFIRPLVLVFASRFGLRQTLITGTILTAAQYPILAEIGGIGPVLYALIVVTAVSDVFYWSSYHATFATLGDDEHRGSQLSAQIAGMALVGIVSPILSGWLLTTFVPRVAFNFSSQIVLFSVIPMLWTPNTPIQRHIEGGFRAALGDTLLLQSMDGFVAAGTVFIWQIALFLTLGGSYVNYGGNEAVHRLEQQRVAERGADTALNVALNGRVGRPQHRDDREEDDQAAEVERDARAEGGEQPAALDRADDADQRHAGDLGAALRAAMLVIAELGEGRVIARPVEDVGLRGDEDQRVEHRSDAADFCEDRVLHGCQYRSGEQLL